MKHRAVARAERLWSEKHRQMALSRRLWLAAVSTARPEISGEGIGALILGCTGLSTLAVILMAALACSAPPAQASWEEVGRFAQLGTEGELGANSQLLSVAVNDKSGEVYVADGSHQRITRFNPSGVFLGTWGWNVIATGPDKVGIDHVEEITVRATGGKFRLKYSGGAGQGGLGHSETQELEFKGEKGPSAELVQEELNGLSDISGEGGRVKVEGGPGDKTGSKPYKITYEGGLGDEAQVNITGVNGSLPLVGGEPASSIESKTVIEGASAFEDCIIKNGDVCRRQGDGGEGAGQFLEPAGIAVDQATGNVYVLDQERQKGVVQVFSADGTKLIASFGERSEEPVIVSPGNIDRPRSITVDSSCNVYVADGGESTSPAESRIMIFEPKTGSECKEYAYTGEPHDFAIGLDIVHVAVDSAGNIYGSNEEHVYKFAVGALSVLACESKETYSTLGGLAANPSDGVVFVYSNADSKERFYELNSSCGQESEFPGIANETSTSGLAVDPSHSFEGAGTRPLGILYAVNPASVGEGSRTGLIFAQPEIFPPEVVAESASNVGAAYATLTARIDTHDNTTNYTFQYGTEECANVVSKCVEVSGKLEAGEEDIATTVTSLQPDTEYHFRVVASSHCDPEKPIEECPAKPGSDQRFTTYSPSIGLPDSRVYELVSPALKDGGEVIPADPFAANCRECLPGITSEHFPMQSTSNGDSVVYEGEPFASTGEAIGESEYISSRTTAGWKTADVSPTHEEREPPQGYKAVSPDLSVAILYQIAPSPLISEPAAPAGYPNLYLEDTATGDLRPLITEKPPNRNASEFIPIFGGASADFSHVVFEANDALTPANPPLAPAAQAGSNVYESVGGRLRLVNVLPGNATTVPEAVLGSGDDLATESKDPDFSHAVSTDGSRIFWTDGENNRVYVRENGEETVKVPDAGSFLTASGDGSRLLLNDGHIYDLQAEEKEEPEVTDLTEGKGGFAGILGASKDLSKVYFVDTAVLAGDENAQKATAQTGALNLYLWRSGVPTVFIGALAPLDNADSRALGIGMQAFETGDWVASPEDRTAQVTPDGRYLAFMSQEPLTGYDNNVASGECGVALGTACYEVFEYDASSGRLSCASCNPAGLRPVGYSNLSLIEARAGLLRQPLNLSENGRVFFDSGDVLSPQDKNPGVENVYEYEPDGLGTCIHAGGCIFPISSGTGETDSNFVDATPSGDGVFFTTRSQLVPQDKDQLIDLYDARVNGGFPAEASPSECSSSEECRASSSSSSGSVTPLSTALTGAGNLKPTPSSPVLKPTPPSRAQLLAKALKACQKQRLKRKRATCVAQARKRYSAKVKTKAASTGHRKTRTTKK